MRGGLGHVPRRLGPTAGLALSLLATACAPTAGRIDAERQEAVARDPAALMRIGTAAEQAGDFAGAGAFYRRAADLQPDAAVAQIDVARSLAEQGRTDEAISTLQAAHARDPANPALAATLGRMLVVAHRLAAALTAFREGLSVAPGSPSLLIGQGIALDATGQHRAAQDSYRQALARDPDNVAAQNDLALSLALSGQVQDSIALLRRVLPAAGQADHGTVVGNLALVYGLSGDQQQAEDTALQALTAEDAARNLGVYAALRSGDGDQGAAVAPPAPGGIAGEAGTTGAVAGTTAPAGAPAAGMPPPLAPLPAGPGSALSGTTDGSPAPR